MIPTSILSCVSKRFAIGLKGLGVIRYSLYTIYILMFITTNLFSQAYLLQSGPMLGYSDYREVMLWIQTKKEAVVHFEYHEKGTSREKIKTSKITTKSSSSFIAKILVSNLEPGKIYEYSVFINGAKVYFDYPTTFQTQKKWKTSKQPANFKFAMGSCVFVNDSLYDSQSEMRGGEYGIFNNILKKEPDFMLWTGDNVYLREGDWSTESGIRYRYVQTRSLKEMQPLLGSVHNYAIWDDHDFGPNDSDRSFIHKEISLNVFKEFWANPSYGLPASGGITTMFSWADVDFFLLDNRYFRSPILRKSGEHTLLGKKQLEWLIDALSFSTATFKMIVVGGLVLSTERGRSQNYINGYSQERRYLLSRIEEEGIKNVFFLTGDKHYTELSQITLDNGNVIYEFSASALTAPVNKRAGTNQNREKGSLVQVRNFGLVEVSGLPDERQVIIRVYNSKGEEIWNKSILEQI